MEDALPSFVNSIVAVLVSPRGVEFTFQIRGREVTSIPKLPKMVGLGDASGRMASAFLSLARAADVAVADASWSVTLYPTDELRARYMTHKPRGAAPLTCVLSRTQAHAPMHA